MPIPTPEEMQYLLGVHPDQVMAAQALTAAANGGAQPADGDIPPPDKLPPKPRPLSASSSAPDANAAPTEITPKPSLIPRAGPRALNVPPVGMPGPVEGTVATGTEDSAGRPMLAKAGPEALPVGAVPPAPAAEAPAPVKPVDMTPVRNLMTTPIRPISGDQAREQTDRTELDRLRSTGSGVDQFMHRHHFLGPLVKGLSIAGSVLAPGPASMIPGTDLHHDVLVHQAEGRVAQDIGTEKAHSQMALSEEAQQAREEANRTREKGLQDKVSEANAKFVAGSEHEDANSPTGYVAQTVGGEWKPFTPPQSYRQNKGEATADEMAAREKQADKLGLSGDERKFYVANGKLREPNPNQSEIDDLRRQRDEERRQHNLDMRSDRNTENYRRDHERWAEHKAAIEKDQREGYAKIEEQFQKEHGDTMGESSSGTLWMGKNKDKEKAMTELNSQKKLLQDSIDARFKELGAEPQAPHEASEPVAPPVAPADTSSIEQPIASVRAPGPAPIGGQVQTPEKQAKPSPATQGAQVKPGDVIGPAPAGSTEGRTGKLPDGTKVVVKGGKIVAQ